MCNLRSYSEAGALVRHARPLKPVRLWQAQQFSVVPMLDEVSRQIRLVITDEKVVVEKRIKHNCPCWLPCIHKKERMMRRQKSISPMQVFPEIKAFAPNEWFATVACSSLCN
jgi:hypothetical protein